jgi:tight adherence protein C
MQKIMPFVVFFLFAAFGWLLLDVIFGRNRQNLDDRLDELTLMRQTGKKKDRKKKAVSKMIEKAAPALAKPLQPKSEEENLKLEDKLIVAGFRSPSAKTVFLGLKLGGLLLGFFLGTGGIMALTGAISSTTLIGATVMGGLAFFLPDLALRFITSRRQEAIFLGLPDVLDLMVVCVEAGLGLDQAMRRVTEEMTESSPVIATEFAYSNFQAQMGQPRSDVLRDLGRRTGVADLRALANVLIQAEKFGSSVATALRVQSDAMRTRRKQAAEEKAAKTAVKLLFPLIIFIFPGIFVVLLGPAIIDMLNVMIPIMKGE